MKRPRRMNVASHNMAVAAYWCVFNIVAAQIMTWRANFSSFTTEYCARLEWTFSTTYQSHKTFPLIFKSPILSRPHSNVNTMMVWNPCFRVQMQNSPILRMNNSCAITYITPSRTHECFSYHSSKNNRNNTCSYEHFEPLKQCMLHSYVAAANIHGLASITTT